ncbi:13682_t:CDS:2, partial [Acaulospora colombiana]
KQDGFSLRNLSDTLINTNPCLTFRTTLETSIACTTSSPASLEVSEMKQMRSQKRKALMMLSQKLGRRLRVCHDVKDLRGYYQLVNEIGGDGMSDEETDPEDMKVLPRKRCGVIVREPRYRSAKYRAFMRLLDSIQKVQDESTLIKPIKTTGASTRTKDCNQHARRITPTGLPKLLYSDEFIKEVEESTGFDLKYTDRWSKLEFPPKLPHALLKNLKITEDELKRMFDC